MKPNFALTLSFEGIGLLHRAFPGWHLVDDVPLDSADLAGDLAAMRIKAQALDATGLRSKLVLPNDQIKYLRADAPAHVEDPEQIAREALIGATPYEVNDLAFDWSYKDGQLLIAAVARETLSEAEAFCADYQFNPVSFVAIPDTDDFNGEPFFGLTQGALDQGILEGDYERDTAPVRVIGTAKPPEPEPAPEAPEPAAPPPSEDVNAAETSLEPETEPEAEHDADQPGAFAEADPPTEDTPAPVAAFSSIRAHREDTPSSAPRLEGVQRHTVTSRLSFGAADGIVDDEYLPSEELPIEAPDEADFTAPETTVLEDPAPEAAFSPGPDPEPEPDQVVEEPREKALAFFTRRSRKRARPVVDTGPAIEPPENERQRMTVFGAREKIEVGGKPRHLGLALMAVLLLFLVGVAAWASIFLDDGVARLFRSDPDAVATIPEDAVAQPDAPVTAEESAELASLVPDEQVSVLDDPATEILSRVSPADLSPDEARARYAATGIWQLSPEPPQTPEARKMEEFYQTSLDPNPDFQDAVALPGSDRALTDGVFFTPASPPAASTQFLLDDRGFVLATPDGALTPDGVRVIAGKPTILPPASILRGDVAATQPTDETAQEDQAQDNRLAALRPRARPADAAEQIERRALNGRTRSELAALRPKLRPKSAQEAAEAQRLAAAEAAAKAEAEAQAEAAAEADATTTDPEAVAAAVAAAARTPDPFAGATKQAVSASLKPNTRPRNFGRIVERTKRRQAQQNQQNDNEPRGQAVAVAAAQKVTPRVPTATSVSKQATQRNALKFKRVNLIGVYGTSANRRALVRMSNGRYKKVKVGDRLDGGRVRAIGDSDLRYTKGSKTVVLKMPRG